MHNESVTAKALAAGKSAYIDLMAAEAVIEASQAAWDAMSNEEQVKALAVEAVAAHPAMLNMPLFYIFTSMPFVKKTSISGAMILPNLSLCNGDIPRLKNFKTILLSVAKQIPNRDKPYIQTFLEDVCFQSCMSTDGRFNAKLGLFERWGVRSVDGWRDPPHMKGTRKVPKQTFHRIKDHLIEAGLIIAEDHVWNNKPALWIRATDKLNAIVFFPGYWDKVRSKAQPKAPAPVKIGVRKPRGLSATHQRVTAELDQLYRTAIDGHLPNTITLPERWAMFERLTQSITLSDKVDKSPFAPPGSYKFKKLKWALGLGVSHF